LSADLQIGAVILGAGFSRRFGTDKRIAPLGSTRVAETTVSLYLDAFSHVRVVLRSEDQALGESLKHLGAEPCFTDKAHLGLGHSLASGCADLTWHYAFIALMDMPFVAAATLKRLLNTARAHPQDIIQPVFNRATTRERGHPVGMPGDLFPELASAHGDQGARWVLQSYAARVRQVPCNDIGIVRDIDQPSDLPE
jgi:molybdenum cofactor cytidylyltransferase